MNNKTKNQAARALAEYRLLVNGQQVAHDPGSASRLLVDGEPVSVHAKTSGDWNLTGRDLEGVAYGAMVDLARDLLWLVPGDLLRERQAAGIRPGRASVDSRLRPQDLRGDWLFA